MKGEHFHECSQRIEDRGISELIGIARGLVADGVVNELEADFLIRWLKENEHLTCWPFDVLNKRVRAMLADGVIDAEERQELLELLRDLIGGKPAAGKAVNFASALPLTQPAPDIVFADKTSLPGPSPLASARTARQPWPAWAARRRTKSPPAWITWSSVRWAMRTGCTPPSAARSSRPWTSTPRDVASPSFPRTPGRRPCARRNNSMPPKEGIPSGASYE